MASLQYKHGSYYAVFSNGTHKKWIRLGRIDKRQAKQAKRKLELEHSRNRLGIQQTQTIKYVVFEEQYLKYCKSNKAYGTYKRELEALKHIRRFLDDIDINRITNRSIEDYKSLRLDSGVKPKTINRELETLRVMLNRAVEWHYVDKVPKVKLFRIPISPVKVLSDSEVKALQEESSLWLRPIIKVLLHTGVRIGEALNLKVTDADLNKRILTVKSPKTNNYRYIPINDRLYETFDWLTKFYVDLYDLKLKPRTAVQNVYLFCKSDGEKVNSIRTSFATACRKAGIKATPHTIRHSYATKLLRLGVDVITVKDLLGHADIKTTQRYVHSSNISCIEAVKKLMW